MFSRILIPVDLSDRNQLAVTTAINLGKPGTTEIILLHVVETLRGVPREELQSFYTGLRTTAEEKLAVWGHQLSDAGFEVTAEVKLGKRGGEIVKTASSRGAELMLLTADPVDEANPTGIMGTITHQLTMLAPCSVMLIRE